jgi:hypothetical protein
MTHTPEDVTLAHTRDDLLSGRYFRLHAASARSRYGYEPPLGRRPWADALVHLGALARESDALAQVAAHVAGRVNLYGTASQAVAAIYDAVADALAAGFDDVILRSGPEPVRFSDAQRPYTLEECLRLAQACEVICRPWSGTAPGLGWAVTRLMEEPAAPASWRTS